VHAEVYPEIWYNTWSGGDTLNSTVSKSPGQTVNSGFLRYTDFPVTNLHSHACPLCSASKLMGLEFTAEGVRFAPGLPEDAYRFESPLVGILKTAKGYEGWYSPSVAGAWTISVMLAEAEAHAISSAEVNGKRVELTRAKDGSIELKGKSTPGKPLRWTLRRA
jgi:hypothetical protein